MSYPLFYHEIASPEDTSQRVVYPNQPSLCRALRVNLMFPGVTQGHSLAKAHPRPPVCPRQLLCAVYAASTHHRESVSESAGRMGACAEYPSNNSAPS